MPKSISIRSAAVSVLFLGLISSSTPVMAQTTFPECLAIGRVGASGRNPIHTDAIEAAIVSGEWKPPHAGDTVTRPSGGTAKWETLKAGTDGAFSGPALNGGYAYINVTSDSEKVQLLEAAGHSMVYVNGEPRTGDPYSFGYTRLPVQLHRGANTLLFLCGRGSLRVKLTSPLKPALLETRDLTLPDILQGERLRSQGAVIVTNASNAWANHLSLKVYAQGFAARTVTLPPIPPLGMRKVGFPIVLNTTPEVSETGTVKLHLDLITHGSKTGSDHAEVMLRYRPHGTTYKRTFISDIDGSVQYFAVNPNRSVVKPGKGLQANNALILSLHGASVEALGQAEAYNGKSWATIVCPTNRRPYGFDWEDWGQMDALEVLKIAQQTLHTTPQQTYLTGHSMGGHGTWHLGVTYPGNFAAIGPSAGWISFFSYAGAAKPTNPSPIQSLLLKASNPSDTEALERNYAQEGVYIVHGDADDNVPVTEAREMKQRLAVFHNDVGYHEQPGAGHWWGNSDEPGAACVDWPPMFDFFMRHEVPANATVRQVDFVTANPGISATDRWVTIEQQIHPLELSSVSIRVDPGKRRFVGTTKNVSHLVLDLSALLPGEPLNIDLDGKKIESIVFPVSGKLALEFDSSTGDWRTSAGVDPTQKNPLRAGPFKQAFQHRMVFVYGTHGSSAENDWALAKARYDAETFWYRGNGSIDIVSDTQFAAMKDQDRGVVLYGNADTNSAFASCIGPSPVSVKSGSIAIGSKTFAGTNLACVYLRPRLGSRSASVAVVSGTGIEGMRLTVRLPYFVSGADFPDLLLLSPEYLREGASAIRAAGIFGNDWSVDHGDFVWYP